MRSHITRTAMLLSLIVTAGLLLVGNVGCRARPQAGKTASLPAVSPSAHGNSSLPPSAPPTHAAAQKLLAASERRTRFYLNSRLPFHEVHVPLIFHDRIPYVRASWSGRQIECMIDTGSVETDWPRWMHLDAQPLHVPGTIQWLFGPPIRMEWNIAPRISIGGFTARNLVTQAYEDPKPKSPLPAQHGQATPTLGMKAFPVILTIDYAHKRLTMRSPDYDITRLPHRPHTYLIHYQLPRVGLQGTLAGHKAGFMLDSGCNGMWIGSPFAHKYLTVAPTPALLRNGISITKITWPGARNLPFTLFGRRYVLPRAYVVGRFGTPDVLMGAPFFKRRCITIDPFRKVVLIEYQAPTQQSRRKRPRR